MRSLAPASALALLVAFAVGACGEDESDKARAAREYLLVELDGKSCCKLTEQQSLEHLECAVTLEPASASYRAARAHFLERLGRRDEAIAELDRAIGLGDSRYRRAQRGWLRCDQRQFAAAVDDFDRALGAEPGERNFLFGRALALVALGRPDPAAADAGLLVRDFSSDRDSHFAAGVVSLAQDRVADASDAIERAIAIDKTAAHPYLLRARLQERVGNRLGALADRETGQRLAGGRMRPCLDPFAERAEPAPTAARLAPVAVELTPELAGADVRWPALWVVEAAWIDRSLVDLGPAPPRGTRAAPAPDRVVLVDARGTHAGTLVVERQSCNAPCGYDAGAVCHRYAEYAHERGALALPALATTDPTAIVRPISPAWQTGLQRQLDAATAWPDAEPLGAAAAGYSVRVEGRTYAVLMARFGDENYPGLWAWQDGRWHHRLLVPAYPTRCERR